MIRRLSINSWDTVSKHVRMFLAMAIFNVVLLSDAKNPQVWQRGTAQQDYAHGISVSNWAVYMAGGTEGSMDSQRSSGAGDILVVKYDKRGIWQWTRQQGSPQKDIAYDVATAGGDVYAVGETLGAINGQPNRGGFDMVVIKWNSQGVYQWTRQWGGTGNDKARAVIATKQRIYVAGRTWRNGVVNMVLLQYDAHGQEIWVRERGPGCHVAEANAVVSDSKHSVYMAGYSECSVDGQPMSVGRGRNKDIIIVKYNSQGIFQWTRMRGSMGDEQATGITVDSDDNVYLTGDTNGALDGNSHGGQGDMFLMKYSSTGIWQWTKVHVSPKKQSAHGIVFVRSSKTIFVVGNEEDDTAVLKFDAAGVWVWTEIRGSTNNDVASGLSVDSTDAIFIVGHTDGNFGGANAGGTDVFHFEFSPTIMNSVTSSTISTTTNMRTTSFNAASTRITTTPGIITASSTSIVLEGFLIIEVTNATTFVAEPKVSEAMTLAVAEIVNMSVTLIRDVKVSLATNRDRHLDNQGFHLTTRDSVRIGFRCAIPRDGGPLHLTASVVKKQFQNRDISEITGIVNRILKSGVLGLPYNAVVRVRGIDLLEPTPSPPPCPRKARAIIVIIIVLSAVGAAVSFIIPLQCYLCRYRRAWRTRRRHTRGNIGSSAKSYSELMHPPSAIDLNCKLSIYNLLSELLGGSSAGTTSVFVTFAMDRRANDVENSGPGIFYAAAVIKALLENQRINCYTSCVHSLSREGSQCNMMIILETNALYENRKCLEDIYSAHCRNMEIFRLRAESSLLDKARFQLELDDLDGQFMAAVSNQTLAAVLPWPQAPHTIQSQPHSLERFAAHIKSRIQCLEASEELPATQGIAVSRSQDSDEFPRSASVSLRIASRILSGRISSSEVQRASLTEADTLQKSHKLPTAFERLVSVSPVAVVTPSLSEAKKPRSPIVSPAKTDPASRPSSWQCNQQRGQKLRHGAAHADALLNDLPSNSYVRSGEKPKKTKRKAKELVSLNATCPRSGTEMKRDCKAPPDRSLPATLPTSVSLGHTPHDHCGPQSAPSNDIVQTGAESRKSPYASKPAPTPVADGGTEPISSGGKTVSPRVGNQKKPIRNITASSKGAVSPTAMIASISLGHAPRRHRTAKDSPSNDVVQTRAESRKSPHASKTHGSQKRKDHNIASKSKALPLPSFQDAANKCSQEGTLRSAQRSQEGRREAHEVKGNSA